MHLQRIIRVRITALGIYLFAALLMYLAGVYFGGILLFFCYCLLLFPVVSLGCFIWSLSGIKYFQSFSTDHPVKGETIRYSVKLSNETPIVIPEVASVFTQVNPLMTVMVPDFKCSLGAKKSREFSYTITCTYRGIYQVGLKSLLVTDISGLFTMGLTIWHRTFYVYPRIIALQKPVIRGESFFNRGVKSTPGGLVDNTLFKYTREYRRNDSLRHIYWKKFAARGEPVLKEYDTSTSPGISLYLDVYNEHAEQKSIQELEREDVSVEILTALVKYYLDNDIHVTVRCPCAPVFTFRGGMRDLFEEYYKQTNNIFFGPYESPVNLFKTDLRNGFLEARSVIFITHRLDPSIFNLVEESIRTDMRVLVIFNHTAAGPEEAAGHKRYFNALRDKGAIVHEVHSPDTIAGDLEEPWTPQ